MSIRENSSPITAFFARGKEIGFVCIRHGDLIDFGVKTITGRRRGVAFVKRVRQTLSCLLDRPQRQGLIVVERVSEASRAGGLCQALDQIAMHWQEGGYSVRFIPLTEAKQRLCGTPNATHQKLIEEVVERHAILKSMMLSGKMDKTRYWEKVVIAMALVDKESQQTSQQKRLTMSVL